MDGMLAFRHEVVTVVTVVTVQMACRPRNAARLGAGNRCAEEVGRGRGSGALVAGGK